MIVLAEDELDLKLCFKCSVFTFFSFSVLATSVNKLVKVNLADTFITNEQMTHILHQVFVFKLLEFCDSVLPHRVLPRFC